VSWNWQRFKDHGLPIYEAISIANRVHLRRISRVIHHSTQFGDHAVHSVRYKTRWQPLHRAEELLAVLITPQGPQRVYLGGIRLNDFHEKLPFLCAWEQPGYYYEVFGY
jgi:hypothetical protein